MRGSSASNASLSMSEIRPQASTGVPCPTVQRWKLDAMEWLRSVGYPHHIHASDGAVADIGVVGLSGMGKSTLLNALLTPGVQLLPAGGVSPLTGVAVRIIHGDQISLKVRYQDRSWVLAALRALQSEGLNDTERGRLSLACTGDQYGYRDADWLLPAIQHTLNPDSRRPPDERPETIAALRALSIALARLGTEQSWRLSKDASAFFGAVSQHTSGQLAPLCKDVELSVSSPLLGRGVALVDLPGVGSFSDSHSSVTQEFLRTASAVMLVVDRAGLTDSVLEAFQRAGFLDRWLRGDAEWLITVTKLDLVANDARRADHGRQEWNRYFIETSAAVRSHLHAQVVTALQRLGVVPSSRIPAIVPVSGDEMNRQACRDEEAPPRLRNTATTGIPELRRALLATTRRASARWVREVEATIASVLGDDAHHEWLMLLEQEGNT